MNLRLLPQGHHWDLHIEHDFSGGNAGSFGEGSGNRLVPHITVSPWASIDSMVRVLQDKGAEPHFVIGGRPGVKHPVVVQLVPLDKAGRSLAHSAGTPETNRAGDRTIQVEICARPGRALAGRPIPGQGGPYFAPSDDLGYEGFDLHGPDAGTIAADVRAARDFEDFDLDDFPICMRETSSETMQRAFASGVASWGDETYKALGNLFELIRHRVNFPLRYAHPCGGNRITPRGWLMVEGILGHCVAPNNDHIDPTADFSGPKTIKYMKSAPNNL